ncbi:unnamed protein product [Paramecium pentaurelia]|uniref:Uncharacterized protein n=1 Tax=Paramecium pentaurelia TaxID=43138 RepID=A0A8S1V062_9CILI|nr:unnamed protein product [Paramecium pentaurelia]
MNKYKNSQDYDVFMAKESTTTQSYLITLIDGTGSMAGEYNQIVEAHNTIFNYLGSNQLKYQWEEELFPFFPFREAGRGNITLTFQTIFKKLLFENYPQNITFLFVSDGQESFEFKQLEALIDRINRKYQIQFISIAIGESYPAQLNSQLRDFYTNKILIARMVLKLVDPNLQKIWKKNCLKYLQKLSNFFGFNQLPVQQTIGSELTETVAPNQPFIKVNDGSLTSLKLDGYEITPTQNPIHISLLVIYSVQYEINKLIAWYTNQTTVFLNMYNIIQVILSKIEINKKEKNEDAVQLVLPLLNVVECIANGSIDIKKLNENQMTVLQLEIRKKEEIKMFLQAFQSKVSRIEQIQTYESIINQFKAKLNKLKFECCDLENIFIRILDIILEMLKDIQILIAKEKTLNIQDILVQLRIMLNEQLNKIFCEAETIDQQCLPIKKINKVLSFLSYENKTIQEIIKVIENDDFMFQNETQFKYLPKNLQPQIIFYDPQPQSILKNSKMILYSVAITVVCLISFNFKRVFKL